MDDPTAERARPIPARAGEPFTCWASSVTSAAYPRAGGGTYSLSRLGCFPCGLSPRGRGNPTVEMDMTDETGPIPARAGEPSRPAAPAAPYPRAGGGTFPPRRARRALSPRGRGNRDAALDSVVGDRPIPARAGEPWSG